MSSYKIKPFMVFAYSYAPDGSCTAARPVTSYESIISASYAALALKRWYDVVYIV